jgi:hypothetical protein
VQATKAVESAIKKKGRKRLIIIGIKEKKEEQAGICLLFAVDVFTYQ